LRVWRGSIDLVLCAMITKVQGFNAPNTVLGISQPDPLPSHQTLLCARLQRAEWERRGNSEWILCETESRAKLVTTSYRHRNCTENVGFSNRVV
jgi:hypothetical protein